jgi:hypothetical protein
MFLCPPSPDRRPYRQSRGTRLAGPGGTEVPPDPQLIGFLEAYDRPIVDLALSLREIILEEIPNASESIYQVYTVAIWFGFSEKMKDMFCYIATNARHVNLGFPRGSTLPDPNHVLEGDAKADAILRALTIVDPGQTKLIQCPTDRSESAEVIHMCRSRT